jgi:large subunit ribosomal protein L31
MAQAKTTQAKVQKTAAAGVNPKQHIVEVVMTDKTKFQILTTWGKEGSILTLDVDPKNHPAWQDKATNFVNANDERMAKFKKKFGNFDF